jgi:hypothetical protein
MRRQAKAVTHRGESAPPDNLAQFIKWANYFRREAAMPEEDRLSPLYILATMRERRTQYELFERMGPLPGFQQEVRPDVLERLEKAPTSKHRFGRPGWSNWRERVKRWQKLQPGTGPEQIGNRPLFRAKPA